MKIDNNVKIHGKQTIMKKKEKKIMKKNGKRQ